MNRFTTHVIVCLIIAITSAAAHVACAENYVAYSLGEAEHMLEAGSLHQNAENKLAHITDPIAVVYDPSRKDLIVVGRNDPAKKPVTLDDLVVSLRAIHKHETWPLVSIDKNEHSRKSHHQDVRYGGGIEGTAFGQAYLDADVLLKNLGLGKVSAEVWGVRAYFDMLCDYWKQKPGATHIRNRFWFVADEGNTVLADREGVMVIKDLAMNVESRFISVEDKGRDSDNGTNTELDAVSRRFARSLSARFPDLRQAYPELERLDTLFKLVALSTGISTLSHKYDSVDADMGFWLEEYRVGKVETPETYPLRTRDTEINSREGKRTVELDGGVELRALVLELNDGSITALRDIVLKSRPEGSPLMWEVPLDEWNAPGGSSSANAKVPTTKKTYGQLGTTIDGRTYPTGGTCPLAKFENDISLRHPSPGTPEFQYVESLGGASPNVGGVMLSGVGKGDGEAQVDLSSGKFSLVVGGENARLEPEMYRKFVTALWAVYFGRRVPGISIDPIYQDPETGDFSEKHMVRYIGHVLNTDLGRVMRETDYLMKKWSVGTEKPGIPGFKTPDEYSGQARTMYASLSRFWLTPEDMSFKAGGNMLLFDGGHMKVKTQVLGYDIGAEPSNPHNEAFARFFTKNYDEIAEKYPAYQELQEYGKLVALARYLKESRIPLLWFLIANKDLILTEDSPGTVENLAKQSEYWRGVTIQGGVDMSESGQYVYDESAVNAIRKARARQSERDAGVSSLGDTKQQPPTIPFSFESGESEYTVVPQHSLTCGKDRRGIRYQTDLCLRAEGYKVTDETVAALSSELMRWAVGRELRPMIENAAGQDGEGKQRQLITKAYAKAAESVEPLLEKIAGLQGQTYKTKDACKAAWNGLREGNDVADFAPLFVRQCHYVANLEIVRYFNPSHRDKQSQFGRGWRLLIPYRVKPAGEERIPFQNIRIPKFMVVKNLLTGSESELAFSTDRYTVAGYVPPEEGKSEWVGLFPMTDGSFRLADKVGSEFQFDPAGHLTEMTFSKDYSVQIEYVNKPTEAFRDIPYLVSEIGEETVFYHGANLPKRMRVANVDSKTADTFVFDDGRGLAAYLPEHPDRSRYKILAPLTDGSHRLVDKNGNEIIFSQAGVFRSLIPGGNSKIVRAISSGGQKVTFDYTIGSNGQVLIAGAHLKPTDSAQKLYEVAYEYDASDRLCAARQTEPKSKP